MKEISLVDVPHSVASLVEELERTGETIVFTRDGKPAARLEPARRASAGQDRAVAIQRLAALRAELAAHGAKGWPKNWEELKSWAQDGRD